MLSPQDFQELPEGSLVYLNKTETAFVMAAPEQCPQAIHKVFFDFQSPFGHHKGSLAPSPDGTSTQVVIDDQTITVPEAPLFDQNDVASICAEKSSLSTAVSEKNLDQKFFHILQSAAPSCTFKFELHGMTCELKSYSAYKSAILLKDLEKKLFRFRQRHPYLLARKVALANKLQKVSVSNNDEAVKELCEISKLSKNIELPQAMTTEAWRNTVCNSPANSEPRKKALAATFYETYQALNELLAIFKKTKTGVLTIRIPRDKAPAKDYWVSIEPKALDLDSPKTKTCYWHPLYKDSNDLILHSNLVDTEERNTVCPEPTAEQSASSIEHLSRHITYNVCSETAFAISNGRGKILALPKGTYNYHMKQHYGLFSTKLKPKDQDKISSEGSFNWSRRRPYPTIKKF